MDIEKWSKKAKVAGLLILTAEGLMLSGHLGQTLGAITLMVIGGTYLIGQSLVDMSYPKEKDGQTPPQSDATPEVDE